MKKTTFFLRRLKRPKIILYIALTISALFLAAVLLLFAHREQRFSLAEEFMEGGDYDSAIQILNTIEHKNSSELILECSYLKAKQFLSNGELDLAKQLFLNLDQYKDSQDLTTECDYQSALILFNRSEFEKAYTALSLLGDYKESISFTELCLENLYGIARDCMYACDFERAVDIYKSLDGYKGSTKLLEYCLYRMDVSIEDFASPYISERSLSDSFPGGNIYFIPAQGLVYVPNNYGPDTKCLVYFAGGYGNNLLYLEGVWRYFANFNPNAVMLFFFESGYFHMDDKTDTAMSIMRQIEVELGICLHDMSVVGSSYGCYTALHAAARLNDVHSFSVKNVLTLDTGMEWIDPLAPDRDCCLSMAESGAELYFFEQPGTGIEVECIKLMVDSGCDVTIVECTEDNHNRISVNAYKYGLFSWALGEYEELPAGQYTLVKLN